MEVHHYNGVVKGFEDLIGLSEGAVQRLHEDASFQVEDYYGDAGGGSHFYPASSRYSRGVVGRSYYTFQLVYNGQELFLVPDVIAAGDDVHASVEDFQGDFPGEAESPGPVLPIGHHQIHLVVLHEPGEPHLQGSSARLAHDVADEDDFHSVIWHIPPPWFHG